MKRDLVVIGASAGGVETLRRVVAGLPGDLPAAVCVVLHLAPTSPSALASILDRAGLLTCRTANDGDTLRHGEVLVAPPDRHLVIEDRHVRLTVGPRENGHRPSVDLLFRSAASALGPRVIGVVLSGTRDDGSLGLAAIKLAGGAAIVQDPSEALYGGMPASALASVSVDAVVPSALVAPAITALVHGTRPPETGGAQPSSGTEPVSGPATDPAAVADPRSHPALTSVCPECGGVLIARGEAGVTHWECRVGHRYSPESLMSIQARTVEATLWAAVRALEDHIAMLDLTAAAMGDGRKSEPARDLHRRAGHARAQALAVRGALGRATNTRAEPNSLESDAQRGANGEAREEGEE